MSDTSVTLQWLEATQALLEKPTGADLVIEVAKQLEQARAGLMRCIMCHATGSVNGVDPCELCAGKGWVPKPDEQEQP